MGQNTRKYFLVVDGFPQLQLDALTRKTTKIRLSLEWAIDAGGADFQPPVVDVLYLVYPGEVAGRLLTILDANALRPVNRDPQKAKRAALDMSVPLNFVYTADTIGGNSGSPVINRKAELVGLNFDSNLPKLANRYMYIADAEGSRAVGVHSAGILEALRAIYGADRIVKEITGK